MKGTILELQFLGYDFEISPNGKIKFSHWGLDGIDDKVVRPLITKLKEAGRPTIITAINELDKAGKIKKNGPFEKDGRLVMCLK